MSLKDILALYQGKMKNLAIQVETPSTSGHMLKVLYQGDKLGEEYTNLLISFGDSPVKAISLITYKENPMVLIGV